MAPTFFFTAVAAFGAPLTALLPNIISPALAANYIFGCHVAISYSPTCGSMLPLDIAAT